MTVHGSLSKSTGLEIGNLGGTSVSRPACGLLRIAVPRCRLGSLLRLGRGLGNCMSSRVLLISSNRCTTPDPVFPLGLTFLNAALRQAGHCTVWLDSLANSECLESVLDAWRPDFIGLSVRNIDDALIWRRVSFVEEVVSLARRLRGSTHCHIILGGSGFSLFPHQLLEMTGADYGIVGAGEAGLVALIEALQRDSPYKHIPGLVFHQNGSIVANPVAPRAVAPTLTPADRPASIASHYLQTSGMLNVQSQRGCSFGCCYCTYPLLEGKNCLRRSPEMVAEEFEQLQQLGARYVSFTDSVFNSSVEHVTRVCEAILRRNTKLSWGCFLRPQGLDSDLMKLMARAGLSHVEFGSDSFCDEVLLAYGKGFTFDDVVSSNELARREHIDCCHYLIAGGPGETQATLAKSFVNAQRLAGAVVLAVMGMRIYPGTPLFELSVAEGRIQQNTDLLVPSYYFAPGLKPEEIFQQLQEFVRRSPNWIVGDPEPGYAQLVQRLRRRGLLGPLWTYFAMMQRLWPRRTS